MYHCGRLRALTLIRATEVLVIMTAVNHPKPRHPDEVALPRRAASLGEHRENWIESELKRLGLLPTKADPVIYRGLGKNGFGLFLYLETALDLQILGRLADSRDRAALLRRIVAEDGT